MVPRIQHIIENGIEKKRCGKCQTYKSIDIYNYSKNSWDNLRSTCKECLGITRTDNIEKIREYNKQYWKDTKEQQSSKSKRWREENKEHVKQKMKEWLENNKEYKKQKDKEYKENNKEKIRENMRKWRKRDYQDLKTNPNRSEEYIRYKLKSNMGRRIREILKQQKSDRCLEYVGCSLDTLKGHLESQFNNIFSWDNYGSKWHIDHIIPCNAFNLKDTFEIKACFYYKNLQPLLGPENIKKLDCYKEEDKTRYLELVKGVFST